MVQNDLWERIARNRLVVLYDQRGTGASKRLQAGASQSMDAQVADLEAVRSMPHDYADIQAARLKATREGLKKLGLQLERRKAPIEVLVIDNLEKAPSDN